MDAQDIRNLQEAYLEVVENQQLDELTPATPRNIERLVTKREKDARKAEDRTGHKFTPEYKKYFRTLKLGKVRSKFDRPASRSVEPASTNEETDLYDIILSHLLDEGYAETPEAAEAIMVNMSEGWRESICEELTGERKKRALEKGGYLANRVASGKEGQPVERRNRSGDITMRTTGKGPTKRGGMGFKGRTKSDWYGTDDTHGSGNKPRRRRGMEVKDTSDEV
jgi:hypothetical protein